MGLAWGLDLDSSLKFTLLALADHADHAGGNARPSVGLIAWKTGADRRTIQRHLRQLESLNLIEATSSTTGGRVNTGRGSRVGHATVYQLTLWNGVNLPPFEPRGFSPDNPQGRHREPDRAAPGTS